MTTPTISILSSIFMSLAMHTFLCPVIGLCDVVVTPKHSQVRVRCEMAHLHAVKCGKHAERQDQEAVVPSSDQRSLHRWR